MNLFSVKPYWFTVAEVVKKINENEKVAILLVEQNAMMALQLSARGYVRNWKRYIRRHQ
jgi:ABC-type branched-subunit amino acid transport system ATPase component